MSGPWIAAFAALWVVTLLVATLVLGLLRRVNVVLDSAEKQLAASTTGPGAGGAPPGTTIGPFDGTLGGAAVSSEALLPGVFVFMSTGCQPCHGLARELEKVGGRVDDVAIYVVLEDTVAAREFPIPENVPVLFQRERAISQAFDTTATPQAFAVDRAAKVVERTIPGTAEQVRELAELCTKSSAADDGRGELVTERR